MHIMSMKMELDVTMADVIVNVEEQIAEKTKNMIVKEMKNVVIVVR